VVHAEVAALEMLAQLGNDAGEDEILRILLEERDIHHVHRPVGEAPERQVADAAVVGHQARAAGGDVRQPVPHLADRRRRGGCATIPSSSPPALQQVAEPCIEIGERLHAVRALRSRILELTLIDTLADEIDERIGLGVHVVLVEQHLGELQHLRSPHVSGFTLCSSASFERSVLSA
jgi:hypothetical protein